MRRRRAPSLRPRKLREPPCARPSPRVDHYAVPLRLPQDVPLAWRKEAVPVTIWQRRCACPGAEQARTSERDPAESLPGWEDWSETCKSDSRQRSQARKEAFSAARSAAWGKTRPEIRDLYIAELRARGLDIPREPLLEGAIDVLSGDPRAGLGKMWKEVLCMFSQS